MNKCEECGQEVTAETIQCPRCGRQLIEQPEFRKPKSKALAVILAIIFGPLGLLYLGMEGLLVMLCVIGVATLILPVLLPILHFPGLGLLISMLARVICVWYALKVLSRSNDGDQSEPEAEALLNEGTKLENVDFSQAIAKYQELIEKYPSSSESKVARTCVETLRRSQQKIGRLN